MQTQIVGLVLSGGNSSRMGTDKSQLQYCNKTWLQHMLDLLHEAGLQKCIVSGQPASHKLFEKPHTQFIKDLIPNAGPLGGIYTCLKLMESDLLVVPVDTPLISSNQLKKLIEVGYKESQTCSSVTYQGNPIPCLIKYSRTVVTKLEETLGDINQSKSVGKFLKETGVKEITLTRPIINFNTPKELSMLQAG